MFISQQQPIGFSKRERLLTEPLLLHQKVTHWWTVTGDSMLITIQDILNHSVSFLFQPLFLNNSQTYLRVLSAHRPCQELNMETI